ncbi:MAG: ATP/ADP translocase [Psychrosphaera sp.]|jgi:ATP/ADP translocase|uniref:MerC domain-containing protein n=1 Tax=Psychrosphaera aquimarina TaxID=2044854 RepID=A0ABU3R3L1_9GAMM|nr:MULTISPECIES: MerC domain-containing protein [Psychrosphaera]MBU2916608.1 MerC domain-containing protein [Psychrosphaera sp. F3M07]MDU0114276.1 MerC domain-containing protein [Psychrosphaera aquimarina]
MRDVLGAWLSVLCMIHCFLPILLVAFGASLGLSHMAESIHEGWMHTALLTPIIIILAVSLPKAYVAHRNRNPAILAVLGVITLSIAILIGDTTETVLTIIGSVFVISAHLINRKKLKSV